MPRPDRHEDAGALQNIFNRGVEKRSIFGDDEDREYFLGALGEVCVKWEWDCVEYCLMGNHFHLVVRTREPTMGKGMHRLKTFYVKRFNEKYDRVGPLFQSRYGSNRLWTPERFDRAVDYVAQNPVEAGLADTPERWEWSSVAARKAGDAPSWLASRERLEFIRWEAFG